MQARARVAGISALLTALVLVAGCDREPEDPFDAYLWQFDRKVNELIDHLSNPDELVKREGAAVTDRGMVTEDVELYRFMLAGEAAKEVASHLSTAPMAMLLVLAEQPADPAWVARFDRSVAAARERLAASIQSFKASMPEDPARPDQDGPVGELLIGACKPGGIYSASPACKLGTYGYDEQGKLFFYVRNNRQIQQLMVERVVDLDVNSWVSEVEAMAQRMQRGP